MMLCAVQSNERTFCPTSDYVHPGRTLWALLRRILTRGNLAFVDGVTRELCHFGDGTEVVIGLTAAAARRIEANPDLEPRWPHSTASAFAACGNSTLWRANRRFARRAT